MRRLLSFLRDEAGATLVEAALVFPLVLILTFGLVELGHAYWEYHAVEKATAVGARWLVAGHGVEGNSTTAGELYTTVVPDCFVTTTDPPGTPCSQVAGKSAWGPSCTGAGVAPCDTTTMSGLLAQMRQYAPFLTAANVKPETAELTMMPLAAITVTAETGEKLLRLMEELEEHDDIQTVYSNFDIPEEVMSQMSQG